MSNAQAAARVDQKTGPKCEPCNATINHWVDLTKELAIFRIEPDEGEVPEFEPGQFATIGLPRSHPPIDKPDQFPKGDPRWGKLVRRAYSIASSPLERRYLELYVVVVEDGKLTPKIWNIKQGGRIWLDPRIKGDFTLDGVPDGKDLVMVSTGTGLAPYLSMLKTYRNTGRWRRFVMIHGVRLAEDLGYREEMEQIAAEDPSVTYIPTCSREPDDSPWTGVRGRCNLILDDETYEQHVGAKLTADDCHVFLCGNPDMIKQGEETLNARGFITQTKKQSGNLHFERYW